MDFQIRITEDALTDFEGILTYSWDNFPATAERFGNAILNHVGLLKSFPYIGSPVDGREGVRLSEDDGLDFHLSFGTRAHNGSHGHADLPVELARLWRDYDPAKTEQTYTMEESEKQKPMFRVRIVGRE